jgi:hypothetical protein
VYPEDNPTRSVLNNAFACTRRDYGSGEAVLLVIERRRQLELEAQSRKYPDGQALPKFHAVRSSAGRDALHVDRWADGQILQIRVRA